MKTKNKFNYIQTDLTKLLRKVQKNKKLKQNLETDYLMLCNIRTRLNEMIKRKEIRLESWDRDEIYNHYIQNHSDELDNDEINEYIDKIGFIYENSNYEFEFLKNQDIMEIDDIYMNLIKINNK